jgi:hypothetical protein
MPRWINRRSCSLLGVLAASQLLSACVVVPARYDRPRTVVVEPAPVYGPPPHYRRDPRDRRDWDRR